MAVTSGMRTSLNPNPSEEDTAQPVLTCVVISSLVLFCREALRASLSLLAPLPPPVL